MEYLFLYLLLPFFILWCINEKIGLQLGIVVLITIWSIFIYRHLDLNIPGGMDISWVIIAVIFCGYLFLRGKIEALLVMGGYRAGMISGAAVSFLMILYIPNEEVLLTGGTMLGICAGYCLNKRYVGFKNAVSFNKTGILKYLFLFVRFLLGITGFAAIILVIGKFIPLESENINLYRFIHFALGGLWVSAAAPWIFVNLRLAGKEENE